MTAFGLQASGLGCEVAVGNRAAMETPCGVAGDA